LLVQQGIAGSGQEMGLEAMRLALSDPLLSLDPEGDPPGNRGLLRPGARLLVVIVSDEDDCSDPTGTRVTLLPPTCGDVCQEDADCPGPGHYCLENVIDPTERRCQENACETPAGRAQLEPVETYVNFLENLDDGTGTGRKRDVSLAVIGSVDTAGNPERCRAAETEAQGVAVRYAEAVALMGDNGYIDSICRDSYAQTLERVAALVSAPQIIDLPGEPPDPSLVRITIQRSSVAEPIECRSGDGFTFEPAVGDAPSRVVMEGRCRLRSGDSLSVRFVCAG
jgi:hypothetical protein